MIPFMRVILITIVDHQIYNIFLSRLQIAGKIMYMGHTDIIISVHLLPSTINGSQPMSAFQIEMYAFTIPRFRDLYMLTIPSRCHIFILTRQAVIIFVSRTIPYMILIRNTGQSNCIMQLPITTYLHAGTAKIHDICFKSPTSCKIYLLLGSRLFDL